jgi:hypothetical protein
MSKMVQALLSGLFITFLLDFFFFLGIFQNYIRVQEIDLYYNILFVDNQSIILFIVISFLLGYLIVYKSSKLTLALIAILALFSLSTLIKPVGRSVAEILLMKKDVQIQTDKYSYRGDILYNGRENITFYDYKFKKVLKLNKNKIIGEY